MPADETLPQDWDLETEAFNLANAKGLPDEVYQACIRRLWTAYCGATDRTVTPAMLEAGAQAFRNSSWHELDPTVIDRMVSDETFGEVYDAMEAARTRPVEAPKE